MRNVSFGEPALKPLSSEEPDGELRWILKAAGYDPDDGFFRGLAYRMMWALHWDPSRDALSFAYSGLSSEEDVPTPWHLVLL
jgi:hypothetical protein